MGQGVIFRKNHQFVARFKPKSGSRGRGGNWRGFGGGLDRIYRILRIGGAGEFDLFDYYLSN
jgi:hypothetical protein